MPKTLSCRTFYLFVLLLAGSASFASADTYYANPDPGATACPCNDPNPWCSDPPNTSTCGSISLPYRCLADATKRACPGDTVIAKSGTYTECPLIYPFQDHIEIKAEFNGQAIIERPASCLWDVTIAGNYITLRGFKSTKSPAAPIGDGVMITGHHNQVVQCEMYGDNTGVYIASSDNTLTDVVVRNNWSNGVYLQYGANNNTISGGEISNNGSGIYVQCGDPDPPPDCDPVQCVCGQPPPSGNTFSGIDMHGNAGGITLGGGENTTIDKCHIHHNSFNGVLEGNYAANTRIQYSEIDHNITAMYLKGKRIDVPAPLGTIHGNSVHNNSGWGIHLWAAPQGTPTQHYVVENNDVYQNGGGIVLGGPNDDNLCIERPQYSEVRYNLVHQNFGNGMAYASGTCAASAGCSGPDTDIGNSFHHNTIYANGGEFQITVSYAKDDRISIRNNLVIGNPTQSILVLVDKSALSLNSFDGNVYYRPGGASGGTAFLWNSLQYSFDQIHASGVTQHLDPNPTIACVDAVGGVPCAPPQECTAMDSHSAWSSQVSLVDPTPKAWNAPYKSLCPAEGGLCVHDRQGDYHLKVDPTGITGGVCCAGNNGGQDIDNESATACTPSDCSGTGDGVGADFYPDADSDGVADLFDCGATAGICDLDLFDPPTGSESMCSANPSAVYDPSVYPGALEVCDGKDNDCDGGSEVDADLDGFFPGCPGSAHYDCNDGDPKVYLGATEDNSVIATCFDGVDNDCDGTVDLDCAIDVFPGGQLVVTGNPPTCGPVSNLGATSINGTNECIQEAGPQPYKLHIVWTISTTPVSTGYNYDLRVEGSRNSGANDIFNFSSSKLDGSNGIGNCGVGDGGTNPILSVSTSTQDLLRTADVGTSKDGYCIKAVGNTEITDKKQDTLTLDRLFVFPSPVAVKDYPFSPPENGTVTGDYRGTQRSDDPFRETLKEEQLMGGDYRLWHTWQFNSVPAGSGHKLHYEGLRFLEFGTTVDDFKFYYSTNPSTWSSTNPLTGFSVITGATIDAACDPSDCVNSSSFGTGSLAGTVYIRIIDAQKPNTAGSQSIVSIDHLAITTVPVP